MLELAACWASTIPRRHAGGDTLAQLTPYPVGPSGYLIGRGQPLEQSHRHFSHLMMVYPLRLVTGANDRRSER